MKKFLGFFLAAATAAACFAACSAPSSNVGELAGSIDGSAWECSQWISAADAPVVTGTVGDKENNRAADGASWFVADVTNGRKVKSARWMTTGLGVYELYLNGKVVGDEVLKPGFTHYKKTKISYTYDITDAFVKADGAVNRLSAQVTPGWWGDKIVTPAGHDGMRGKKCAFRSVLELTYADGGKELFGTDTLAWKAGIAGPVKHAAIFDGEEYDARVKPGYETPELLGTPEVNSEFAGEIVPTCGAEIYLRPDIDLKPVLAYTWSGASGRTGEDFGKVVITKEFAPGEPMQVAPGDTLVIDFGQNASAVPCFEFQAAEGVELTCLPGEMLNDGNGARSRGMDGPEGSVHRENLRCPESGMILKYTFGPQEGFVTYCPRCTFFGYRYISVTATAPVQIKSVVSIPVTSITSEIETGRIETGDESINKLISNTLWGQRSNYLSVPTDCPQRNERLGWTADTQVFTETGSFFADTRSFFRKWMRDMRDSQSETGGFPGVAPKAQYGGNMSRVGWADAGVIVPWTVWKQFGDVSIVEENWDAMERWMAHIAEVKYDHTALAKENGNYQWADWLSYEALESHTDINITDAKGNKSRRPEVIEYWNYLSASYWAIDAAMMEDMSQVVGEDGKEYAEMLKEARAYIKERFLNEDGTFKLDTLNSMQTPALFALKNELVEGEAKAAMIQRLRDNFAAHDGCLQTGFLGTSILMQTLTDNGMADIAWDLLFQRKNPSWLYSVDNGATTIWERWNSYMKDKGMGPKGMNSFNHYAYGCVCQWIWETAAGISADPADPGFRHIVMKPVPDKRLGWIKAEYPSAAGLVKSSWKFEGDSWTWKFTVPKGVTATVTVPGESESKDYKSGTYTIVKQLS